MQCVQLNVEPAMTVTAAVSRPPGNESHLSEKCNCSMLLNYKLYNHNISVQSCNMNSKDLAREGSVELASNTALLS
jgi:hypothetical protein